MRRPANSAPALLAVLVLAGGASGAERARPEVRSLQLAVPEAGAGIVDAGQTFSAVGPHWKAVAGEELALSVSPDGVRWGRWMTVPAVDTIAATREDGTPNPYAGEMAGALVFVSPDSRYVRVRRLPAAGFEGDEGARRVALHVIDPGPAGPWELRPALREAALSAEVADPPGPRDGLVTAAPAPPPLLPVLVPRAQKPALSLRATWGARPPKAGYTLTLAGHIGVHHTATVEDFSPTTWEACAARVRAIQAYHMDTNGWNDLGYAYLICRHGDVFQGREDDDDTTDVQGAHDGLNRGSTGISLMGYFHPPVDHRPTDAQVTALVGLVAWISDLRGIDPNARSVYEAFGAAVDNVYGHREVKATACPGDHLFALKELVRASALELILFMPL